MKKPWTSPIFHINYSCQGKFKILPFILIQSRYRSPKFDLRSAAIDIKPKWYIISPTMLIKQSPFNDSISMVAKVRRSDIAYLNEIIEGYDNLAVMRTIDSKEGLVEFLISPSFVEDMKRLLAELRKEIPIEDCQG